MRVAFKTWEDDVVTVAPRWYDHIPREGETVEINDKQYTVHDVVHNVVDNSIDSIDVILK